jgi:ubiquinone/menaquinone biosynthesis C-methylase UbiE
VFHPNGPSFFELARQALSSTERGYDLLAPKFDYTPFRTPDWLLESVMQQLKPLAPFESALDLCCGTGAGMRWLLPTCRQGVIGVDFSAGMLHVCRERLAGLPGAPRFLVHADVLSLPFGPEFDLATCFGALGHILPRDEPRFIAEVFRVLKPGGRFAFVTSFLPPFWSRRYLFSRLFNAAMHTRNALLSPPFIMYYLTFRLPDVLRMLNERGFDVEVRRLVAQGPFAETRLVIARRPLEPRVA